MLYQPPITECSPLRHSHGPIFQVGEPYTPELALKQMGIGAEALPEAMAAFAGLKLPKQLNEFYYGTVTGLFRAEGDWFELIAVVNRERGNGHFERLMGELEEAYHVRVFHLLEIRFANYLTTQRGYVKVDHENKGDVYERKKIIS